jgi:transmembrane sensor
MTDQDDQSHEEGEALRREAIEWLTRLSSGETTAADGEALSRWCGESPAHAAAFAEANLLWSTLGPAARNVAARAVAGASAQRPNVMARRAFLGAAGAAVAASVGYLIVRPPLDMWPSISELAAQYRTGTGERRQLAMADGAAVEMNTRTSLNLEAASSGASRIELITGEAVVTTRSASPASRVQSTLSIATEPRWFAESSRWSTTPAVSARSSQSIRPS